MRYRTGRHNHRIVYRQLSENPSDEDVMLAVFMDASDAMAVVSMLNGDDDDAAEAPAPHICDYVEPDGATHGVCHLPGEHGGRERSDGPVVEPPPADAPEPEPALLAAAHEWVVSRFTYGPIAYASDEARAAHIAYDARNTAMEATPRHFWAAGVAEGRRQRDAEIEQLQALLDHAEQYARDLQDNGDVPERTEVEYGVRVDAEHPTRKETVGTVMTHLGEQKSRMCHDIYAGWTPVKRMVQDWQVLAEDERLRAPWKRAAEPEEQIHD